MAAVKLALLLSLLMTLPAAAGDTSKELEAKIVERVKANSAEALALLEKVVNINSGTMNFEGVRSVGDIFAQEFHSIGFETRWIDMQQVHRAGHLFAEHKGSHGKRILIIGHLDTVFEKEEPFQRFQKEGTRALGQGVNDMKGGDVIALFALKALHDLELLKDAQIIVAFHGDEESSGDVDVSRRDIIEAAKRSDAALGYETCEGMATATIARRGIGSWSLKVTATPAHSSLIFRPEIGGGAIFEVSRILNAFYQELSGEQYLTFNPGIIVGGTEASLDPEYPKGTAFGKDNVIAQTVLVDGDLRFISVEQKERARARMQKIVNSNHVPKASATIEFSDGYPPMPPTDGNRRLLSMLDQVSRDLGLGPVEAIDPSVKGAADISFVAPYVDGIDGLGAMGNGGHTNKEDIDLTTFIPLVQRSAVLIYRLTH